MTPIATTLDPAIVRRDSQTQIRVDLDPETIALYELMIENADLHWPFKDPVVIFHDGRDFWLADGFQRDTAWQNVFTRSNIGVPQPYPVELHAGTLRDALHYATHEANRHGKPFSSKDRRNHAKRLLLDEEWTLYSNREIGRITGLDEKTIRNIRKELAAEAQAVVEAALAEGQPVPPVAAPTAAPGKVATADAGVTLEATAPTAAGVTVEATAPTVTAPALAVSAEIPQANQQAMLFDVEATPPATLLPPRYAPTGDYEIVRLATSLSCVLLDSNDLHLCGQPATLAYAVLDVEKAVWTLRPVCESCAGR